MGIKTRRRNGKNISGPLVKDHWSLLFVSDKGNVIALRRFQWLIYGVIGVLLLSIATTLTFGWLYYSAKAENQAGEMAVVGPNVAKPVAPESNITEPEPSEPMEVSGNDGPAPAVADAAPAAPDTPEETGAADMPEAVAEIEASPAETIPASEDAHASLRPPLSVEVPSEVAINDFSVNLGSGGNQLVGKFNLSKTAAGGQAVSGYLFVVAGEDKEDSSGWLSYPAEEFAQRRPQVVSNGSGFSISKFKRERFAIDIPIDGEVPALNYVGILVFNDQQQLQLEEWFDLVL